MLPIKPRLRPALMLMLLPLWLHGCAHDSPLSRPAPAPLIPPLPAQARQPATIPECSPTCSRGLTSARESWLRMLTPPGSPASPASGPTTP